MAARSILAFSVLSVIATFVACGTDDPEGGDSPSGDGGSSSREDGAAVADATPDTSPGPEDAGADTASETPDAAWVGPDGGIAGAMNFFVTSRGKGSGGDFRANPSDADGLAGADAFCKSLAEAVSPVLGAKTWRAYLSTATVTARSRIGNGPWINAKGVVIATSTAILHDEGATNALSLETNLDEYGNQVSIMSPNVHDILTGATAAGGSAAAHCANWTSSATNTSGQVGHSNRNGGGAARTSWNSAHASAGCAEMGANSVRSGGGRGSIYCFAN
ncbi:MAG: DUF1554 domain-containing protein [Labilithrix sp.]|nr:DUF1554 domain-containing protein [Labilithrix sp.]